MDTTKGETGMTALYKEILELFEKEELIVVEKTKWMATHPWEHKSTIVEYLDNFYRITERRKWREAGHFIYDKEQIVQVKRRYKTRKVVKVSWVVVPPELDE
jgi:hypothetical protein